MKQRAKMLSLWHQTALKFLITVYVVAGNIHCAVAVADSEYIYTSLCEDANVNLNCENGELIQIKNGSVQYGPLVDTMCLESDEIISNSSSNCFADSAISNQVVRSRCHNKPSCQFRVTDSLFSLGSPNRCDVQELMPSQLLFLRKCALALPDDSPSTEASSLMRDLTATAPPAVWLPTPTLAVCRNGNTRIGNCSNWTCIEGSWIETPVAGRIPPVGCRTVTTTTATTTTDVPNTTTVSSLFSNITANTTGPVTQTSSVSPSTTDTPLTTTSTSSQTISASTSSETVSSTAAVVSTSNSGCLAENTTIHYNLSWPEATVGQRRTLDCPGDNRKHPSFISRRCGENGIWSSDIDVSTCASSSILSFFDQEVESEHDLDNLTSKLVEVTLQELVSGDIIAISSILTQVATNISSYPDIQPSSIINITKNVFNVGDNLLNKQNNTVWTKIAEENRSYTAMLVVSALESVARKTAASFTIDIDIKTPSIEMAVRVLQLENVSEDDSIYVRVRGASIEFPSINLKTAAGGSGGSGYGKLVTVFYRGAGVWSPQNGLKIYTPVFSASLVNNNNSEAKTVRRRQPLSPPFKFTLRHLAEVENNSSLRQCVFWDECTGNWSEDGCRRISGGNSTHSVCECNHLTNFAVLVDVGLSETTLGPKHTKALHYITYVGCIISIICLLLAWLTFQILKNLSSDRNTIHKHLVFTLMLAETLFLLAITPSVISSKIFCSVLAGMLHYLFLCVFAWTCLEGVQLYIMLIEVFEAERSRILYYYLIGYGIPAIVVGVSAAVDYKGYGTSTVCWLSAENNFRWSFMGPVAAVMLVNVVMLGIAIYMMYNHARMVANIKHQETTKGNSIRAWLKGAVVLVVLLGLTWLFGFMAIDQEPTSVHGVVMAYIFTILNSLQGLFIFIFHCFLNEKVQKEYKKFVRRTQWLPNCIRVKYGEHRGLSSVPSHSSGSNGYLARYFSRRRKSADFISGSLRAKKQISGLTSVNSNEENCNNREPSTPLTASITSSNHHVCNEQEIALTACDEKLVPTCC